MIYDSILDTIGDTPVVGCTASRRTHVTMYVKVESFNPMASVKDRLALRHHLRRRERAAR